MVIRRLLPSLLACLLCIAPASSHAQTIAFGVDAPQIEFEPELTSAEISIIARVLALGPQENDALRALHEGHLAALKSRRDEISDMMQEKFEEAQLTSNISLIQVSEETKVGWKREADEIRGGFLSDLKSLLSKEQSDRWPLVERELRRYREVGKGQIGGESIDVIRLVDQHVPGAWAVPGVSDLLLAYADAFDSLSKSRAQLTTQDKQMAFMKSCSTDKDAATKMWEDALASRVAIRDLNLRTAERVASMLPEPDAQTLRSTVFAASFPRFAKPTPSEGYIRAAASLDSLTADQRAAIAGLMSEYERNLWALRKSLAAAAMEKDLQNLPPDLGAPQLLKKATTEDGQTFTFLNSADIKFDENDPITKLNLSRLEMERGIRRRIQALLTEEQHEACRQKPIDQVVFGADQVLGL